MLPTHLKRAREKPDRRVKYTYLLLEELKMCSEVRWQLPSTAEQLILHYAYCTN